MIISHRHRFIFIRTRKTASTSTELVLASTCGPDDIITPVCDRDEALRPLVAARSPQHSVDEDGSERIHRHASAAEVRAFVGEEVWADYFTFCTERNPWEKVVSLYYHRHRSDPRLPLDDFVFGGEMLDARNAPLYTDGPELAVDRVLRYENLVGDLRATFDHIGIGKGVVPTLPRAKAQFRTDRRPAREALSTAQQVYIGQAFAEEVERFGYRP